MVYRVHKVHEVIEEVALNLTSVILVELVEGLEPGYWGLVDGELPGHVLAGLSRRVLHRSSLLQRGSP